MVRSRRTATKSAGRAEKVSTAARPSAGDFYPIAATLQGLSREVADKLFVIHHQHRPAVPAVAGKLVRCGQCDREGASIAGRAFDRNGSAVCTDDSGNRRQPEPAPGEFGREEGIEDAAAGRLIHAAAGIADFEHHLPA